MLTADITVNSNLLNSLNDDGTVPDGTAVTSRTRIRNNSIPYTGTFDGQNHTISGLYLNDESTEIAGLFSEIKGTIKNVGVVDSYIHGGYYVGGVCADNYGTITNRYYLADSMSVYGDSDKAYFNGGTVAEQTVTDDLSVYDFTVGTMPEGISYYGSSLMLKSETTPR